MGGREGGREGGILGEREGGRERQEKDKQRYMCMYKSRTTTP